MDSTFSGLLAVLAAGLVMFGTYVASDQTASSTPMEIARFLDVFSSRGQVYCIESFQPAAQEALWSTVPQRKTSKDELLQYLREGPDGPGLAYAAVALIPFSDPGVFSPMLDRVDKAGISYTTAWVLANCAAYLCVGNGNPLAKPDRGAESVRDGRMREMLGESRELGKHILAKGPGRFYAEVLAGILEKSRTGKNLCSDDYEAAAQWADLLFGRLDLADGPLLLDYLEAEDCWVPGYLPLAVMMASNQGFLKGLEKKEGQMQTLILRRRVCKWWRGYNERFPDGAWKTAVREGFRTAGYEIEQNLMSEKSLSELRRALDSEEVQHRYNACRLLTLATGGEFDLCATFFARKHGLYFLEWEHRPFGPKAFGASNHRIVNYWKTWVAGELRQRREVY